MVTHGLEFQKGERKFQMAGKSLNGYELNKLWRNEGGGRFADVSIATGAGDVHDARGFAACDFDRDGDLDLFIRNYRTNSVLLRNEGIQGHWLAVRPEGTKSNRDGIGARVEIVAGGVRQMRWITAGSGYLSQMPNEAYFGLGSATRVDMLTVTWTDGTVQRYGSVEADRRVKAKEGAPALEVLENRTQPVFDPAHDELARSLAGADIRDLYGNRIDVTTLGPVTFLNFWATWCNVCRSEIPDLTALEKAHASAGAHVASVAVLDPQGPDLARSCEELKIGFPVYTITRAEYDRLFGAEAAVPRSFLLEKGRVSGIFPGKVRTYLVRSYLLEALRSR